MRPSLDQIYLWLGDVLDPEVPVISVVDLGIVRDIHWEDDELVVMLTPTYSGCPANAVIALDIETALRERGIEKLKLLQTLSPPWTTDWISARGRAQLLAYGIAPPATAAPQLGRLLGQPPAVACPRCASTNTSCVSQFGSTACKAQYQCRACLEPFDYFKCI